MKKGFSLVVLFLAAGFAFSQSIIGGWKVENQFEHSLGFSSYDRPDLKIFTGNTKVKKIDSLEFRDDGTAIIILDGGTRVNAFFHQDKFGYYLQPQGGKDTNLSFQPIAGNMMLAVMDWRYPADSYTPMILILSKVQ